MHDCFGTNYALINETSLQVKHCYYDLGFDDHQNLVNNCIIEPNFKRSARGDKYYLNSLAPFVVKALSNEYAGSFPRIDNILIKHKSSVLNSCYWYPFSD